MLYNSPTFQSPILYYDWVYYSGYYAADMYSCPYNVSSLESAYPLCDGNGTMSEYMDPNIPDDQAFPCVAIWISDGLCDDACRHADCGNDGTDCDEGRQCEYGGICREIYRFWGFLGDGNKWNTTYFCDDMWPVMLDILGSSVEPVANCSTYAATYDYNGDGHLNHRELVPITFSAINSEWTFFQETRRGPTINCSECWGMSNYNV